MKKIITFLFIITTQISNSQNKQIANIEQYINENFTNNQNDKFTFRLYAVGSLSNQRQLLLIKKDINEEVEQAPTPVTEEAGAVGVGFLGGPPVPSQKVYGEARKKVEEVYDWKSQAYNYLERTAPIHGSWEHGYGANAFRALHALEKQLSFFKQNGMTPLEAAAKKFDDIKLEKVKSDRMSMRIARREKELEGLFGGRTRRGRRSKKTRKGRKARRTRRV